MSLRQKTIKGGAILAFRQGVGMVLSVLGVLLITRIIGPSQYGLFAAGVGIVLFLGKLGSWGLDVYLVRKNENPTTLEFDQAFTLLLSAGLLFGGALITLRGEIAALMRMPEAAPVLAILAMGIPFNLLSLPAAAKLDRDLNFKRVSFNELLSQTSNYALAIPLALKGAGAWAPALGYLLQQVTLFVLSHWSTGLKPGLHWDRKLIRQMLAYGLSYSSSIWVWQLRTLVNPLIVGRFAGAEAVAYVAVSIRITEMLSFAKSATWRIAMAALARLNMDRERLQRSIIEGMRLQALAVGLPLAAFALIGPFVLPRVLGERWLPTLQVFPFIALSYLSNAMFNLHSSVLYLLRKNMQVAWFHVVHIALFASTAALLVPHIGFRGYGWAEVAALLSYFVIHKFVAQAVGSPSYAVAAIWYTTGVSIFLLSSLGTPLLYFGFPLLLVPLLFSKERTSLIGYAQTLLSRTNA